MSVKTILILGGGAGGLVTANRLRQQVGDSARIVLVERNDRFFLGASYLWLMVGLRRPDQISKDLRRMIRPGIELVHAEVQEIDVEQQLVRAGGRELRYDYLIVALGAELAADAVPGFAGAAHNFYELTGADSLRRALPEFHGGRVAVAVSSLPFKCPAAPYEAALLLHAALRRRDLRRPVDFDVFTPEPLPMPVAGPVVGQALKAVLEERGIRFHPQCQLTAVDGDKRELHFGDGRAESFDLLAGVPSHRSPQAVRDSALAGPSGWIPVDARTLKTRFDNVYAIGDVTAVTLPNGKLLPKAGVFAHFEGEAVSRSVAAAVQGNFESHEFDGTGYCWIEMGNGIAGFGGGQFYAEPDPVVNLRPPGWMWHFGKVLFEQYWVGSGLTRSISRLALALGSRFLGIPAPL